MNIEELEDKVTELELEVSKLKWDAQVLTAERDKWKDIAEDRHKLLNSMLGMGDKSEDKRKMDDEFLKRSL